MKRILVGLDGSAASLDALRWTVALADAAAADFTAVYAFTPSYAEVSLDQYEVLRAQAEQRLIGWSADSASRRPVNSLVIGGDPSVLLTAAGQDADLLVVGTRGAGGFAHLHLGSVAHHLAHHTSVPLAIVPTSAAGDRVARIVIGVDGSPGSAAAVAFCAALAPTLGATVVALHTHEPNAEWATGTNPRSWREAAATKVHEWVVPIAAAGVAVEVNVDRDRHPVDALSRAVEAEAHTLAVVGTRGLGGFSGLRLGRVPIHLVHHTGAAVVMVPPGPSDGRPDGSEHDHPDRPLDDSL
ncbi:MAG TPA: universal stress protein [Acidimicrobiia bacterium]|nr:universal stress protein [Acidimicrobiia bacterium]